MERKKFKDWYEEQSTIQYWVYQKNILCELDYTLIPEIELDKLIAKCQEKIKLLEEKFDKL